MQENNLNLFDLPLHETYPWETLHDEHKILAIDIRARLIASAISTCRTRTLAWRW